MFDEAIRTTSAVESFNAQLGRTFQHHGNLFRFVSDLKSLEAVQVHDMRFVVNGGQRATRKSKKDQNIEKNTAELKINMITPMKFLQRLTGDDDDNEQLVPNENSPYSSSDEDEDHNEEIADDQACIVCYANRRTTLLLPCRHLKCCSECIEKMKAANNGRLKCPYCNTVVTQTIEAFI